ncbi:MAG: ornithine cyclodeaminase [Gammaproteobacteria bacterium]|nr:ornithine cyclodeaminase [Gammaproteobacteria bacterium]
MILLEIATVKQLIIKLGIKNFFIRLVENLQEDFGHWSEFEKSSRHAIYVENGVLELMPVCNKSLYSFKYVNGHPNNAMRNKLTVVALGMLADVNTGYPLLLSEMTLLTAIRTAATSALASRYLAKTNSKKLAIIGCGAQSEFQVLAHHALFDLSEVHYFDLDNHAMERFVQNLSNESFKLIKGTSAQEMIKDVDIIVTATAAPGKNHVLEYAWLQPGQHICGIGGDSVGKTELDPKILKHSKVVVEYFSQTAHEGEVQNLGDEAKKYVYAELWQLVTKEKPGRQNDTELTLFDSVGFALEDFSVLRLVYELAKQYQLGKKVDLIPESLSDCKNLFGLLKNIS